MSYSKTEMWSLTVRSMVDLRAMASREEWMGWCSSSVARNSRQGTMALRVERVCQNYSICVVKQGRKNIGGMYLYSCSTSVITRKKGGKDVSYTHVVLL